MDKVRFACPKCQTIMQTGAEKIGYDVACPHCQHRFRLIESSDPSVNKPAGEIRNSQDDTTMPPSSSPMGANSSGSTESYATRKRSPLASSPAAVTPGTAAAIPVSTPPPQAGFCCPYCQTKRPPTWKSEVSQVGWIVFAILLITTCVFCFVGLFIRDKYRICSQCKIRLG
jgi:DNA-directed RNA polymerase subunit M/transcription elongation factor TFIIS